MAKMDVTDQPTLRQLFEAGWEAQRKTESGELSSNTQDYKVRTYMNYTSVKIHFNNDNHVPSFF